MVKFGVAQPVTRKEDLRLLTGGGRYVDDTAPEGAAWVHFLRSPVAHARLLQVDAEAARKAPGVLAVFTAEDLEGKLRNSMDAGVVQNRDGTPGAAPIRPILAADKVAYVGEAVAAVVAETQAQARDAAELIELNYEELPVAFDTALAQEQPEVHPEVALKNVAFDWAFGDEAATRQARAQAAPEDEKDGAGDAL